MRVADGHASVEVVIKGRRWRMLLDTGSDGSVLTPATAAALGLPLSEDRVNASGGSGSIDPVAWTSIAEMAIGDAQLRHERAYVIPVPPEFSFDGVLGASFFGAFVARMDMAAGRLRLTLPDATPVHAEGHRLPLRQTGGGKMLVQAQVAGLNGWFSVDTGAALGTLTVFTPTVERHQLRTALAPRVRMTTGVTVSGVEQADVVRAPQLSIGPWALPRPVIELALASGGLFGSDGWLGNLGSELWRRFAMTIDLARGELVLEPNAALADPFPGPRSGLAARPLGGQWTVIEVLAGSPAAEAGCRHGDIITQVDGQLLTTADPSPLRQALRRPGGSRVSLRLRSAANDERDTALVLRELI